MKDPQIDNKSITEIHLNEYRALREEQKNRLTMNSTILNVIVLIVGGELAAYVQMALNDKISIFTSIVIFSPIVTTPLVLMYYDNHFMVYRVGKYFSMQLYPRIKALSTQDIFGWEGFHRHSSGQLALVAFGRNIFFVFVTAVPLLIFAIIKMQGSLIPAISFRHPLAAIQLLTDQMLIWECWVVAVDFLLLIAVLITWVHSGIMFRGIGKVGDIRPVRPKGRNKKEQHTKEKGSGVGE